MAISSIHTNAFLAHYIQQVMLEEITMIGLNVRSWETRNLGECVFINNKYGNSLTFIFFFFSCLSALLIGFYMAKNKPEDGLLNFKLEETKVVVVSCD